MSRISLIVVSVAIAMVFAVTWLPGHIVEVLTFVCVASIAFLVMLAIRDRLALASPPPVPSVVSEPPPVPSVSEPPRAAIERRLVAPVVSDALARARATADLANAAYDRAHPPVPASPAQPAPAAGASPPPRKWSAPSRPFLDRIAALIGDKLDGLRRYKFTAADCDPLLTVEQSRLVSIVASAQRRHGHIIERALCEALADCDHLDVVQEPRFRISHAADSVFRAATEAGTRATEMPYGDGDSDVRTVEVDLIVFDYRTNTVRAYEIKRGDDIGSAATRDNSRDVHCVGMLLRSYAAQVKGWPAAKAESWLVGYYGKGRAHGPFESVLSRAGLDAHFGFPVVAQIEAATATFKNGFQAVLSPAVDAAITTKGTDHADTLHSGDACIRISAPALAPATV